MVENTNSILETSVQFLDEYIPKCLEQRQLKRERLPIFIFISGPQGSGKSYTAALLYKYLVEKYGERRNIACTSIDDFYLTHKDQLILNEKFTSNKLLQGRGLPGTHDIPLLARCFEAMLQGTSPKLSLPLYDKSKFNGQGDRSDKKEDVDLPLDILIMEGWFLGFEPVTEVDTSAILNDVKDMVQINANLSLYSNLLWKNPKIESLGIVFDADKIENVYDWRLQQEQALRRTTGHGMKNEEVKTFIDRYFPSYQLYYKDMVSAENLGSIATLTLTIDQKRNIISCKDRCIE